MRNATSTARSVTELRELILSGELPPGTRLGEVELAERLGTSRTPVREALRQLAAEGLVDLPPNRGARVASWSVVELNAVFEVRTTLEPRLTALATAAATDEDIDELEEWAQEMSRVGAPGAEQDLEALVPLNRRFHDRLVELANAPALAAALAGAIRAPLVRRNFHAYSPAALRRSLGHHHEIVAALRERDPEWAAAVMTAHIHNARAVLLRTATPASGT
ncbi:GntR family transcriptional regulator [Amycolatopsis anabasis]|uniref:GntR family transcriptional regulator n=1 Tax=Amycolatopsis anabasis TaxID=1840409 RepID=UPI0024843EB8|nr:GntR family transcriptional regulator [Amycolatopsis anabasis]